MKKLTLMGVVVALLVAVFATAAYAKVITGTNDGRDILEGTPRADLINGMGGTDELYGKAADDDLFGGRSIDSVFGNHGDDDLTGGRGNDVLVGSWGNDTFYAHDGYEDDLYCGPGVDRAYADDTEEVADNVAGSCEFVNGVHK